MVQSAGLSLYIQINNQVLIHLNYAKITLNRLTLT